MDSHTAGTLLLITSSLYCLSSISRLAVSSFSSSRFGIELDLSLLPHYYLNLYSTTHSLLQTGRHEKTSSHFIWHYRMGPQLPQLPQPYFKIDLEVSKIGYLLLTFVLLQLLLIESWKTLYMKRKTIRHSIK